MITTQIKGQHFVLSPLKALFWQEQKTVIISDLHLGKIQHFRKSGIAVPSRVGENNFLRIQLLIEIFQPNRLLILGDLFHSDKNKVWELWVDLVRKYPSILFELVLGNHDILDIDLYINSGIAVFAPGLVEGPFYFSHDNRMDFADGLYNIHGHIHPAIKLHAKSRDGIRLPCFCFFKDYAILPAFGAFTGTKTIRPEANSRVFGIIDNEVLDMAPLMKES